jgi:formylmethanofuran dehydrogenase subunit D
MALPRLLLMPIRTSKQGQQVNIGKDHADYLAMTTTLTVHPDDLKERNIASGSRVIVRTDHGEAEFVCTEGKVPRGMAFVPYGPPTCKLMGGDTDGTGMPTSKGWEFDMEEVRSAECGVRSAE